MYVCARIDEVIDALLDQPGVETDPLTRLSGSTPLHLAVTYINSLSQSSTHGTYTPPARNLNGPHTAPAPPPPPVSAPPLASDAYDDGNNILVEILLDAGCDPRIKDKSGRKPVDVVERGNEVLKGVLRRAEILIVEGEGIVDEDGGSEGGDGPASDSD